MRFSACYLPPPLDKAIATHAGCVYAVVLHTADADTSYEGHGYKNTLVCAF